MKTRRSYKHYKWRKLILEKYQNKCVNCGSVHFLHAHHIKEYSKYPELRYDINNGICLCKYCHADIHPFMKVHLPVVFFKHPKGKKQHRHNRNFFQRFNGFLKFADTCKYWGEDKIHRHVNWMHYQS